MLPGASGLPDPTRRLTFVAGASSPVQLTIGPSGDLFYVDLTGGRIMRVQVQGAESRGGGNAVIGTCAAYRVVYVRGFRDPDDSSLTYAWDLDDDGLFDDGNQPTAELHVYRAWQPHGEIACHRQRWTERRRDPHYLRQQLESHAAIVHPSSTLTWRVGDVIAFNGTGDRSGGRPAAGFSHDVDVDDAALSVHVPPTLIQEFDGVANGQFTAPDHDIRHTSSCA